MLEKIKLFRKSLSLVWESAPGWTIANIILSVMRSALPLAMIWLMKILIDSITSAVTNNNGVHFNQITFMLVAVVIIYYLDEAASDLSVYVRKKQSVKLEGFMYNLLHSKAINLDLISFERPEYYDCLSRATKEAPWRPNNILNNMVAIFKGILSLMLMAGLISTLNWMLVILLIAANIPGIWLRLHYADVLYNFHRKQTPEARKSSYFNWLITGDRPSRELRLFGLGNYFIDLFKKSFRRHKDEEINIIKKRTSIELVSDLFKAAALFISLLFIIRQVIEKTLSLGQMAMFLLAFRQLMIYTKEILISVAGLYEDSLFIGDTFEFLNLKENIKKSDSSLPAETISDKISIENVSFTYPGNNSGTINNISLEINKEEVIAIVGPNGAGKSTLARLLCRLYDPDSGVIKYDGTDIRNIDPLQYRKQFSVVFQDFMLYNMNVKDNIAVGNTEGIPDVEGRMEEAARKAGIHDFITDLPNKYDTVIGNLFDDSRELSWGEWQKLAIARALFRDAQIMILDEPSSSIDADTEYEIFSRFSEIFKGKTSILISHRFSNVHHADRIIVLDKGEIIETGNHKELLNLRGTYFKMFKKQNRMFNK